MVREMYDVAIIGSGIGGMSAAALLSRQGYKVLVTERFRLMGGRCSTLNLNGYLVSTGAIALERGGALEQVFTDAGAHFPVKRPDPQMGYYINGKTLVTPPKGGLRWLLHQVAEDERDAERVMVAIKRAMTWDEPSSSISFTEWLKQYTTDPKIHGALQGAIVTTQIINAWETPAATFIQFMKNGGYRDFGLTEGGNISAIENLAKVVRGNGGTIWTACPVKRILVNQWTAVGLLVDGPDGEAEVGARVVISSAGPKKTIELAGRENFERGYLKDVYERIRPAPVVAVFVASDRPLIEHPGAFVPINARRLYLAFQATLTCPELAPKGMHYLEAFSTFTNSHGPANIKEEIALNIQDIRDIVGDAFDKHGRILAAECFDGDWPAGHTWPGYDVGQKTSIEGLYNVGDGVKVPGWSSGTPAAAKTALVVVEDILNRYKPGAG